MAPFGRKIPAPALRTASLLGAVTLIASACSGGSSGSSTASNLTGQVSSSGGSSSGIPSSGGGSTVGTSRSYSTDVMIYNGSGAWTDEVGSLESIMSGAGITYTEVTDTTMNSMAATDYAQYGMMLFPGGSGTDMLDALNDTTRTNVMNAVRQTGVNYLGFCAGAFMAVSPAPSAGGAPDFFSIIQAPEEDYYYLENQGVDEQMVEISFPSGSTDNILWYGGPVTPDATGGVIAKYPTGDPAMTEEVTGAGFTIVSGVHPAATLADIEAVGGTTTSFPIALQLIQSVLSGVTMPAFSN